MVTILQSTAALLFAFSPIQQIALPHPNPHAQPQEQQQEQSEDGQGSSVECVILLPRPLADPQTDNEKIMEAIVGDEAQIMIKDFPKEGMFAKGHCPTVLDPMLTKGVTTPPVVEPDFPRNPDGQE